MNGWMNEYFSLQPDTCKDTQVIKFRCNFAEVIVVKVNNALSKTEPDVISNSDFKKVTYYIP